MKVIAKFRVIEKKNMVGWSHGAQPVSPTCHVVLSAVSGDTPENKTWARYTPSGRIEMQIDNPDAYDAFELGAEYLLTFEKTS